MEFILLSTCGLVANHYLNVRSYESSVDSEEESYELESENVVSDATVGASGITSLPHQCDEKIGIKEVAPIQAPLGVRTLKTHEAVTPGYDQQRFDEQFYPQDPNPPILSKGWMSIHNAPYKPKEEILNEDPTPEDIRGTQMRKKAFKMEQDFAKKTVPVTSEKQHDRPVEQIATGNGSNVGFHIGGAQRYRKYVLNDQPTIEAEGGPRGAFSGGGKSDYLGEYKTTTQRASMNHESVGPPVAIGVPQSHAPLPSFEITASHMESWKLDDHSMKNSRAPISRMASISKSSVSTAHDENLQVLETSLARGGERFATGASGNRETLVHVPKNNDFHTGFDDRVVPNFKIGKASDKTDQEIRIKDAFAPELSQNVSALRKNSKAPVSGDTVFKSSDIDTTPVSVGTSSRGLSLQAVKTPLDAFRTTDKKEKMGEAVASLREGSAPTHMVSGMKSGDLLFRTTNNLSETVSTPFIRGGGGKQAPVIQPVHADTDTSLSEVGSFYGRAGANSHAKPVNTKSMNEFNDKKDAITSGSERKAFLASKNTSLPGGLSQNPTGSVIASGMKVSLKDENAVDMIQGHQKSTSNALSSKSVRDDTGTTKNRRMGDMLNSRLGSSNAVKKLLKNPYSRPAASRMSSV